MHGTFVCFRNYAYSRRVLYLSSPYLRLFLRLSPEATESRRVAKANEATSALAIRLRSLAGFEGREREGTEH